MGKKESQWLLPGLDNLEYGYWVRLLVAHPERPCVAPAPGGRYVSVR